MSDFDEETYERGYPREILHAKTEIMLGEQWQDCELVDISSSGARLIVGREVSRGDSVFVKLGGLGPFGATVAWCQGDAVGVKFDHDPDEMTRVLIALELRG